MHGKTTLNNLKKREVDVALLFRKLQVSQCIIDCIKLEFNDKISLYKKNDSERKYL